ncbi:hypothetical protein MKW92_043118 [Papaver armeniacum]|nr:hypothetical protein MKW92_043118 [Papaver armeniacum]
MKGNYLAEDSDEDEDAGDDEDVGDGDEDVDAGDGDEDVDVGDVDEYEDVGDDDEDEEAVEDTLDCHILFASFVNEPQFYFVCKDEKVRRLPNMFFGVGSGSTHAEHYLGSKLGFQHQDESFADHVDVLVSAVGSACTHDQSTGDQIKVYHMAEPKKIHLVRHVHEHDVEREKDEDAKIDLLEKAAERMRREELSPCRG